MSNDTYIRINAKRLHVINYLGGVCSVCNEKRSYLLNCHHVDPNTKKFTIRSHDLTISKIIEEADKCVLLCYNCHRDHHSNNYSTNERRRIMKTNMLDYKKTRCCVKCGYDKNMAALDFHHLDNSTKEFDVSLLKGPVNEVINEVKLELDKCEVLCSNCHHDIHFNHSKYSDNYNKILEKSKNIKSNQGKIDRDLVYDMYVNQKIKKIDIAKHFNASKGTISDILKKYGLCTKKEEISLDEELVKQLHSKGLTCTEIGLIIKSSASGIFNLLKRNNLTPNVKSEKIKLRKFNPTIEELVELRKTMTFLQIGNMYGVSGNAVRIRLNKYNK